MDANTKPKQKPRGRPFTGRNDPRANRGGRPLKSHSLSETVRRIGGELVVVDHQKITRLEAVVRRLYKRALDSDRAAAEIMDRAFGRPAQSMDITSGGEQVGPPKEPAIIRIIDC